MTKIDENNYIIYNYSETNVLFRNDLDFEDGEANATCIFCAQYIAHLYDKDDPVNERVVIPKKYVLTHLIDE